MKKIIPSIFPRLSPAAPPIKRKRLDSAQPASLVTHGWVTGRPAHHYFARRLLCFLASAPPPTVGSSVSQSAASSAEGSESVKSSCLSDALPWDERRRRPFCLSCVRCCHDKLMLMRPASVRHPGTLPAPPFPAFDKTLSDRVFYRAPERRTQALDYILRR